MTVTLKKSTTAGAVPTSAQLIAGELAINVADGKLFTERTDNVVVAFVDDATSKSNPTLTGTVTVNGQMVVVNQIDVKTTMTASTATTALDLTSAGFFKVTIAANTTFSFSNFPSGVGTNVLSFTLMTINDATAGRAVAWPAGIKWAGGIVPTRTTAAGAIDTWTFFTEDGGATWIGSLAIASAS